MKTYQLIKSVILLVFLFSVFLVTFQQYPSFFLLTLQEYGNHDNVIKLLNVMKAENDKDIYLVFEFMGKRLILIL